MSRSYKHTPYTGFKKDKDFKKLANKRIRKLPYEEGFTNHKRYFDSWDICDYKQVGMTFEQFYAERVKFWHLYGARRGESYPSREECRKDYEKWYLRK